MTDPQQRDDAPRRNPWDAEFAIDAETARRRIEAQFPALAPARLEPCGEGWDNVVFRVNERYAFRFPRRTLGLLDMEVGERYLNAAIDGLPVATPVVRFCGAPDDLSPHPFLGVDFVPGTTACRVRWTDSQRATLAAPLARTLRTLHDPGRVAALAPRGALPSKLYNEPLTRDFAARRLADMPGRMERLARRTDAHLLDMDAITALASAPWDGVVAWVHGDLYARHLVVDDARQLTGLIDWGDAHLGDRARDLCIVYSFLPPEARAAFWSIYGEVDAVTRQRARFYAYFYGVVLELYGDDIDDADLLIAARDARRLALAGR